MKAVVRMVGGDGFQFQSFQSPCGERVVKVLSSDGEVYESHEQFQSPCGERVVKDHVWWRWRRHLDWWNVSIPLQGKGCERSIYTQPLRYFMILFQSPCGERVVKVYNFSVKRCFV